MMINTRLIVWILSLTLALSAAGVVSAGVLPSSGAAQYELEFWESIKNSTHAEDYQAYLKAYPNGRFAPLAKIRAARYAKSPAQSAAPPAVTIEAMDSHYVVVASADVRTAPSLSSKQIGELKRGEHVHVTGRTHDKNWYRIELGSGTEGFVYAELLHESVAAPAPAPAPAPQPKPKATPKPPPVVVAPKPLHTPTSAMVHQAGTVKDCAVCPEMVVLQPGRFVMGDNHGDPSERPAHRVTIRRPFAIGKYEVTEAQWNACAQAGACKPETHTSGRPDKSPAKNLSWIDAQQYVHWLSQITHQHYRLPTEAEWEYAARAGTTTRYWWGEKMEPGKANCKGCGGDWNRDAPANVDALPPNPFGIYGTNGGVWEWVEDCWHRSYRGAPTDGSAWTRSDCRKSVIRGGSWRNDSSYAHSTSRFNYDSTVRYIANGFRVAKSLR